MFRLQIFGVSLRNFLGNTLVTILSNQYILANVHVMVAQGRVESQVKVIFCNFKNQNMLHKRKYRLGNRKVTSENVHVYKIKLITQPDGGYDWLHERVLEYPFYISDTRNMKIRRVKNPDWKKINRRWYKNMPIYLVTFTTMLSDKTAEGVKKDKDILSIELLK